MAEVKGLLKDAIVVGHDIRNDERALCFSLDSVAHRVIDTATNPTLNNLVPSEKGKIKSKLSRSLVISSIPSDSYYTTYSQLSKLPLLLIIGWVLTL